MNTLSSVSNQSGAEHVKLNRMVSRSLSGGFPTQCSQLQSGRNIMVMHSPVAFVAQRYQIPIGVVT
jgi:hypothetical protein